MRGRVILLAAVVLAGLIAAFVNHQLSRRYAAPSDSSDHEERKDQRATISNSDFIDSFHFPSEAVEPIAKNDNLERVISGRPDSSSLLAESVLEHVEEDSGKTETAAQTERARLHEFYRDAGKLMLLVPTMNERGEEVANPHMHFDLYAGSTHDEGEKPRLSWYGEGYSGGYPIDDGPLELRGFVTIDHPEYALHTEEIAITGPGYYEFPVVLRLEGESLVAGAVYCRQRRPMPNVVVRFRHFMGRELDSTVTGYDGRFEVRGVEAGKYRISARLVTTWDNDKTIPVLSPDRVEIPVGGSNSLEVLVDREYSPGFIEGYVVDEDGLPLVGARVDARAPEYSERCKTNQKGSFYFCGIQSITRSMAVKVYLQGYNDGEFEVPVANQVYVLTLVKARLGE
jgi:hypothetical protein